MQNRLGQAYHRCHPVLPLREAGQKGQVSRSYHCKVSEAHTFVFRTLGHMLRETIRRKVGRFAGKDLSCGGDATWKRVFRGVLVPGGEDTNVLCVCNITGRLERKRWKGPEQASLHVHHRRWPLHRQTPNPTSHRGLVIPAYASVTHAPIAESSLTPKTSRKPPRRRRCRPRHHHGLARLPDPRFL